LHAGLGLQTAIIQTKGLRHFNALLTVKPEDVTDLANNIGCRYSNYGGLRLSLRQQTDLKALIWWAHDKHNTGTMVNNLLTFGAADLADARERMQAQEQAADVTSVIDKPEKFKSIGSWVSWWESVKNYLGSVYGVRRRPLLYIVRPAQVPINPTQEEQVLHSVTLTGAEYRTDNATVYRLLKSLTLDTEAYAWVQGHDVRQDGRAAALALMA